MCENFHNLQVLVSREKLYLQQNLKSEVICRRMGTNPRKLIASLKSNGFRNFSQFVNHFRVEEAKRMMASPEYAIYTLEAIANMAGFGTRQAFYNTFENITGISPGCYRNQWQKKATE
jgi:AraC-like DNA-binding protein